MAGEGGDDRTIESYDPETTELLLGITADVLRSFGGTFGSHVAIVGGLVPTLLIPDPPGDMGAHVGTADIDLCLSIHLLEGDTADYYASIVDGLSKLGLQHGERNGRTTHWRWVGMFRGVRVVVDLLSPQRQSPGRPERPAAGTVAEENIGQRHDVATIAVAYGHLVALDTELIPRRVAAAAGNLEMDFPVAGLTSWLCLKADGIQQRDKTKDSFDVVWVLQALGPEQAAEIVKASALLSGEHAPEVKRQLQRLATDQFRDADSIGPGQYAAFHKDPESQRLRADAVATVELFARTMEFDSLPRPN